MVGILTFALCVFLGSAHAQVTAAPASASIPKFALVIGNSNYSGHRRSLKNPVNDSKLIAQNLRKLGFDVKRYVDLDRQRMIKTVAEFADGLPEGSTALVFYAGHGMQIGGASYLVPVDMVVTSEQSVPLHAYPLKTLLERVSASRSAVNIVVLDACRDNPFQPESPVRYRSFSNLGLAPIQAPVGTIVAYSTSPGQLSADGKDANSIYSATLAEVILEPQLSLEAIFKRVGVLVRNKTQDDQIPWFESSLSEEYFFLPPDGVTMVAGRRPLTADAKLGNKASRRNVENTTASLTDGLWYRSMSENEWSNLDRAIQQRVSVMTPADIDMMEHKARGGSVVAQTTLGLYWLSDFTKTKNLRKSDFSLDQENATRARYWLRMAAKAGFSIAQTELGQIYAGGQGVARDLKESRRLLALAANASFPRAKLVLDALKVESGETDDADLPDSHVSK